MVLSIKPSGNVTVAVWSDNDDVKVVRPTTTSLLFTPENWDVAQTVEVKAEEDDDGDDERATLYHAEVRDGDWRTAALLAVTVSDDDTAGVTLTPTALDLKEGERASYKAVLSTKPSGNVTVDVSSDNDDVEVKPTSLLFTPENWDVAQTVEVKAEEDDDGDDERATLYHAVRGYGDLADGGVVAVTVSDDDTAGVTLTPTALDLKEGERASYKVVLSIKPSGNVTVDVSSDNDDVEVKPTSLLFTPENWDVAQTVEVKAEEDDDGDDERATLYHAEVRDGDWRTAALLAVTVSDDDTAGVTLTPTALDLKEGERASYKAVLSTKPSGNVTVDVSSDNDDVEVKPTSLLFTPENWDVAQTVEVKAEEDDDGDDERATLYHAVRGYGDLADGGVVAVTVSDDDTAGVTLTPTALDLKEGERASYKVVLSIKPSGNVTVDVSSDNDDVEVKPTSLLFTPENWDVAQTVEVKAEEDDDGDDERATLYHAVRGYGDLADGGVVAVTVSDDDTAGVALTPTALDLKEGERASYKVVLSIKPSGNVTVDVSSDNDDVEVKPTSLLFTPENWDVAQTVEVKAEEDDDGDDERATLYHAVRGYGDLADGGVVAVTVSDDDTAGVALSTTALTAHEDDTGTYTVRLATAPAADVVTVTPRSSNSHIEFTPTSLTFDFDNWNTPQEISFRIEEGNESRSVTIRHEVSGYGDLTEGGVVTVSVVHRDSPDAERKQTVERTVAGVAAAAVSNVSSNIGARFSAPSGGTSVSLAGTPVAFGSAARSQSTWTFANRVDPFDEDSSQSWQRTMNGSELLRSSSFEIALGAAEGSNGNSPDVGRQFTIWGRGDFQVFESGGGRKSGYDGDMVAGYLGADFTTDGRWLLGMAVSRIAAEADYTLGSAGSGGTIDAELTNLHPYLRVALDDRSEAWAILGFGKGEVTDKPRAAAAGKSDLSMRMVSAGARHRLNTGLGIDLALLGDGSLAEISTDEGVETVDGISASIWRARAGVEASYTSVWEGGSSLTSFMEVAARKDGGDSTEGVGLELSPGLAFSNPESGFSMEARARALALHSADNHKEYGASITASLTPGSDGLGLSMVVAPTWGTQDSSLDSFETSLFSREGSTDRGADSLSLNSRVSYGFAAGRGVLAPFAELTLDDSDRRRVRIGSRYSLGSSAVVELFGDRIGDGAGSNEHSVQIRARIGF